ncbi:LANO_0G11430g1_1 [Lachancea nothofagi CBS 11611]|uniref:LANO_0G11430g1_1 n=1 Tax=Lachancea nothofagi CBS 11611 TaxID=1266666 RepID=A0A1G4KJM9_9SACH|nr:LANO_0G11430g1_1 [Lachancea nothofagi CBS 11611]
MQHKKKDKSQVDHSINFIQEHHFKDTFALLVVFLSFNHFASLCLLSLFIVTTKSRNFLATSFIRLFLSNPTRAKSCDLRSMRAQNTKNFNTKPDPLPHGDHQNSGHESQLHTDESTSRHSTVFPLNFSPFFALELVLAGILKAYASQYFARPIENLALSIIASSLINDPRDCLSYATSCSILYGLAMNLCHRVGSFLNLKLLPDYMVQNTSLHQWHMIATGYPLIGVVLPKLLLFAKWSSKYVRLCRYFASFHIVLSQFYQNMTDPYYLRAALRRPSASGAAASVSMSPQNSQAGGSHVGMSLPNGSVINSGPPSGPPLLSVPNTIAQKANFCSIVSDYNVSELSMNSPSDSNQQTITTNVTTTQSNSQTYDMGYTNHFFEINLSLDLERPCNGNLDAYFITTSNLENFILQLFKWKNHHLIPPLWSIFTTIKTMTLENRKVRSFGVTSSASNSVSSNTSQPISPTSSNTVINESVFTGPDSSDCMTLIAPAADDYNQLHLMPLKQATDYKVCISNTGPTQITFHITNLFEGELIVLVNGVIWSQVLSAITSEKMGEEYTVVSGLVPSCSYDIQFVNRFNEGEDYLIADMMVRTCAKIGENKEPLDFSFPSYYHRKFLSPLLTLKHSVLTTNTNLAEERAKVKKTKKEISKKLSSLRQESDHLKSKIAQNASQDEKSAFKMDNLKTVLQQSEAQLAAMEDKLKGLLEQELQVEEEHLQQKDKHLQNQMEYGKLKSKLEKEADENSAKLAKLQQELSQLTSKREKVNVKQEKLKKEVSQYTEDMENFKSQFLSQRQRERQQREEMRSVEANEYELKIKGLEQDISRLEGENEAMNNILRNY